MAGDQQPTDLTKQLVEQLDVTFALQAAGLGIWEYDPLTKLARWDERCRALYGLHKENTISYEEAFQYIHPDDVELVQRATATVLASPANGHYDVTFRTIGGDDGRLRWVRFIGKVEFNQAGEASRFAGVAQDVTQQILSSTNQEQLLRLFEQSPVGIALIDADKLTFRMANPFYGYLVGRAPDQLVGKPLLEALPELVGQGFDQLLNEVITTGQPFIADEVKVDIVRNDQLETIYVNLTYQPRREASGTSTPITGILVVATDVTAQVRTRQQVEASEVRFRRLIEEAPVATALYVGPDLHVQVANQTMLRYWGKDASITGQPLAEALPELAGQPFLGILADSFITGQVYEEQAAPAQLVVNGALTTFYFDYTYKPLRNEQGAVYAIMNMAVDVTQQVIARQALEENRAALNNAVDLAELGTWTLDIASGATELSPHHATMFGLTKTSLSYEEALSVVHPADRDRVQAAFEAALKPGSDGQYQAEYRIINATTGEQQVIRAKGKASLDTQGEPLSISGTTQDITLERGQQAALEQQVRQRTEELRASNEEYAAINEELAEANSLLIRSNENLQTFAYVASHDLQEPLRKIQQFGNLLQLRQGEGKLDSEAAGYVERMQLAASRMSTLIKDLLNYSRISTQRSTEEPVLLNEVIDKVLDTLEVTIAQIDAQVQVDTLSIVSGDAVQLSQLFQNLLSNALKFHRPDVPPKILIRSERIAAEDLPVGINPTRRSPTYECIQVVDNGIGFEEKYLDRIFQVFQRLHGKSQYAGTGVGLAICEKVVANHGGVITASSQPGQGATFSIYLPATI